MLEGAVTVIHDFDELAKVFEKPWQGPQFRSKGRGGKTRINCRVFKGLSTKHDHSCISMVE